MKIEAGTIWQHYKGKKYTILALCRLESSNLMPEKEGTILVVYAPFGEEGTQFARPIQEWMQPVKPIGATVIGDPRVPRFEPYAANTEIARSRMRCE